MAEFIPTKWQVEKMDDTTPVLYLSGGRGIGKTRLAMEKVNAFCLEYSGAVAVIISGNRETLLNTVKNSSIANDAIVDRVAIVRTGQIKYKNGSSS